MSLDQWCKDSEREQLKYLEKNKSQCHFVHHKFHKDWPRIQPWSLLWEDGE